MIIHYILEENTSCRYCLQALSTEQILQRYIKYCFKINGNKEKVPKKGEYVRFKNLARKIKSPF